MCFNNLHIRKEGAMAPQTEALFLVVAMGAMTSTRESKRE